MRRRACLLLSSVAAVFVAIPAASVAGIGGFWEPYPARDPCAMACAGWPNRIAPWARRSYDATYRGYHVGGGAWHDGDVRCFDEGTWGVDYDPWYSRVALRWWHGRRSQGGEGQYEPDGKVGAFGH